METKKKKKQKKVIQCLYFKIISETILVILVSDTFLESNKLHQSHLSPDVTEWEMTCQNLSSITPTDISVLCDYLCVQPRAVPLKHPLVTYIKDRGCHSCSVLS